MCADCSQLITSVTEQLLQPPLVGVPFRDEQINHKWSIYHWCPFITVCWFFAADKICYGNSVGATPLGSKPLPKLNPPRRSSFRDEKINRRWQICHWCLFINVCWFFAADNIRYGTAPTKSWIIPFVIQLHCTILLLAARSSQLRSLVPVRVIRLPLPRVFTHFC